MTFLLLYVAVVGAILMGCVPDSDRETGKQCRDPDWCTQQEALCDNSCSHPGAAATCTACCGLQRKRCVDAGRKLCSQPVRGQAGAVRQQRLLEHRIGPSARHNARTDMRTDPRFIRLDDPVERLRIDIALLGQDRLQGAHAQLHLGEFRAMAVIVMSPMIAVRMMFVAVLV